MMKGIPPSLFLYLLGVKALRWFFSPPSLLRTLRERAGSWISSTPLGVLAYLSWLARYTGVVARSCAILTPFHAPRVALALRSNQIRVSSTTSVEHRESVVVQVDCYF